MLKSIHFVSRVCPNCGRTLGVKEYSPTKNPLFVDGHLPLCTSCISQWIYQEEGNWDAVDLACQWADIPFLPERFTGFWKADKEGAMAQYLKFFSQAEYSRTDWKEYWEKWKNIIGEGQEKLLHKDFNQEEINRLVKKFGVYSSDELLKMEEYYCGIEKSFGFSDIIAKDNACKMAKLSFQIDKAIAADLPVDKLISSYSKLQNMSGFTSDNAHDANAFESFSEVALFYEQIGWDKKFHNDTPKDIVDQTMRNIQSYSLHLYNNESTMADQIEARVVQKKNIDDLEERLKKETSIEEEQMEEKGMKVPDEFAPEDFDDFSLDLDLEGDD